MALSKLALLTQVFNDATTLPSEPGFNTVSHVVHVLGLPLRTLFCRDKGSGGVDPSSTGRAAQDRILFFNINNTLNVTRTPSRVGVHPAPLAPTHTASLQS